MVSPARYWHTTARPVWWRPKTAIYYAAATRRNLPRTVSGDRVLWQASNPREGVIVRCAGTRYDTGRPDHNNRVRPVAANIDQIVVVIACKPSFEYGMLDRYLVAAELIGATTGHRREQIRLCWTTKAATNSKQRLAIYQRIGYALLFTSTHGTDGLRDLHQQLKAHTSVLVGQSGVGKSSLVQALLPELDIRTGSLSQVTGLGRHTTTVAMLYHLPDGGDLDRLTGCARLQPDQGAGSRSANGLQRIQALSGAMSLS